MEYGTFIYNKISDELDMCATLDRLSSTNKKVKSEEAKSSGMGTLQFWHPLL